MEELAEIKQKIEHYENKREEIMAALNSIKGQKEMLSSQRAELSIELTKIGCNNLEELEKKIKALRTEIEDIKIEIPDDVICNLQ